MRPRILITRPQEQLASTHAFFEEEGFDVAAFPVLVMQQLITPEKIEAAFHQQTYDGMIITSQQALAGLNKIHSLHNTLLFVPGSATAEAAHEAGFLNVITAKGTAESLAAILPRGNYLYLRAEEISVPLTQLTNVQITELVTYRAKANSNTDELMRVLTSLPDAILFYSAKTAFCFEAMVGKNSEILANASAIALSGKVVASLRGGWKHIVQSATPDEAGMLKALETLDLPGKRA